MPGSSTLFTAREAEIETLWHQFPNELQRRVLELPDQILERCIEPSFQPVRIDAMGHTTYLKRYLELHGYVVEDVATTLGSMDTLLDVYWDLFRKDDPILTPGEALFLLGVLRREVKATHFKRPVTTGIIRHKLQTIVDRAST